MVPRGPFESELFWTFLGFADDDERKTRIRLRQSNLFGPAGFISLEDGAIGEFVQKAIRAGVSVLAAIGAPSSLAVNLAVTSGLTLVGFLREAHCNVYSYPERLTLDPPAARR